MCPDRNSKLTQPRRRMRPRKHTTGRTYPTNSDLKSPTSVLDHRTSIFCPGTSILPVCCGSGKTEGGGGTKTIS
eukprot:2971268-Pyramimonas_sp.AAC.1